MEQGLIMALVAFALGGVLKGAIGAGTPVVAVPIMALYYGVPFAVAVFALPSLLSNLWQAWKYRAALLPRRFVVPLGLGAAAGAAIGSVMLANLSSATLMGGVAAMTLAYVGSRLARPGWTLPDTAAQRIVWPVATLSGILQGAAGISAPVSITYLNAMRLGRESFIATISLFFGSMSLVQVPLLAYLGVLTSERLTLSAIACVPLFAAMAAGAWMARFIPRDTFDRIVMALLVLIALRLLWQAVA